MQAQSPINLLTCNTSRIVMHTTTCDVIASGYHGMLAAPKRLHRRYPYEAACYSIDCLQALGHLCLNTLDKTAASCAGASNEQAAGGDGAPKTFSLEGAKAPSTQSELSRLQQPAVHAALLQTAESLATAFSEATSQRHAKPPEHAQPLRKRRLPRTLTQPPPAASPNRCLSCRGRACSHAEVAPVVLMCL